MSFTIFLSDYIIGEGYLFFSFGMYHDTEKIGCKAKQGNTSHIMTPSFDADTVEVNWSRCSRRDITNFLEYKDYFEIMLFPVCV